jgi:hypothetical protein
MTSLTGAAISSPAADAPAPLDDFVALSAILTGIAGDKLHPTLDAFGTAREYLVYATDHGGALFGQLMALYLQNSTLPPDQIAGLIFQNQQAPVAYMARTVMLMWYLGSWYGPDGLAAYHANTSVPAPFVVISSNAYTQGWAWRVGQAHPMGYSDWRFGYWNTQPPALDDFIGGR